MSLCINPYCLHPENTKQSLFCDSCGSELLLDGRYRVMRTLGKGGFATTYEVLEFGKTKALKVLHQQDDKAVELFQREFNVLSQLNHPGIPKVEPGTYFYFQPNNSSEVLHCLVMEKIEGMDLEKYIEQRQNQPISEQTGLAWMKQLTEILQTIHRQSYFHRDIKPSNIILQPDGQLSLIDFGAVREMSQTYMKKSRITGISSAGYTPPEQINGKAVPSSDFFALGRTFVFLFTGKHPEELNFDGRTGDLIWRHNAPQISKGLVDLINWFMEYVPGNRPQRAEEIVNSIAHIKSNTFTEIKYHPKKTEVQENIQEAAGQKIIRPALWKRCLASMLDNIITLLLSLIPIALCILLFSITDPEFWSHEESTKEGEIFGYIFFLTSWFFTSLIYHSFIESHLVQASFGKRLFGIHIVSLDEVRMNLTKSFQRAFLRNVFWVLISASALPMLLNSTRWIGLFYFLSLSVPSIFLLSYITKGFLPHDAMTRTRASIKHTSSKKQKILSNQNLAKPALWKRLFAFTVDFFILNVVSLLVLFLAMPIIPSSILVDDLYLLIVFLSFYFIFSILYHALSESSDLQGTLGKRIFGVYVTDFSGQKLDFWQSLSRSFSRNFFWMFDCAYGWLLVFNFVDWIDLLVVVSISIAFTISLFMSQEKRFGYDYFTSTKILVK